MNPLLVCQPEIPKIGATSTEQSLCQEVDRLGFTDDGGVSQQGISIFTGFDDEMLDPVDNPCVEGLDTESRLGCGGDNKGYCPSNRCIDIILHRLHARELSADGARERDILSRQISRLLIPCAIIQTWADAGLMVSRQASVPKFGLTCICGDKNCVMFVKNSNAVSSIIGTGSCEAKPSATILPFESIMPPPADNMAYHSMPDLSLYIRACILRRHFILSGCISSQNIFNSARSKRSKTNVVSAYSTVDELLATSWLAAMLTESLPCIVSQSKKGIRHGSRPVPTPKEVDACLSVLCGTLLQVYPKRIKTPTFRAKVTLLRRVWGMMNRAFEDKLSFVNTHESLIHLSLQEYTCNVLRDYMPVELEFFTKHQDGMSEYLEHIAVVFDTFRRECILTGDEEWDMMNSYCRSLIDRSRRTYRVRVAQCQGIVCYHRCQHGAGSGLMGTERSLGSGGGMGRGAAEGIRVGKECVQPWMWDAYHVFGNRHVMSMLYPDKTKEELMVACGLQRVIQTYALPVVVRERQQQSLELLYGRCEMLKRAKRVIRVCTQCAFASRQISDRYRLDLQNDRLSCEKCKSEDVLSIDMVGILLGVGTRYHLMCPGCCSMKQWIGLGSELISCNCNVTVQKQSMHRCAVCQAKSVVAPLPPLPDFDKKRFLTLTLCSKHRPPNHILSGIHEVSQVWKYLAEREAVRRDRRMGRGKR